jgi:hypothetical protein
MPEYDFSALAGGSATFFPNLFIIGSHTPHYRVKATGCAIIIDAAVFSPNNTGLHPYTGMLSIVDVLLHAGGIHLDSPLDLPKLFVIGYWLLVVGYL